MKIAVLSGKGGTGKTFISVNLSAVAGVAEYIDCDVEEPNGHLFFKPVDVSEEDILVKVPCVDSRKCIGCRKCVEFCKFNALACVGEKILVFEEICHSCGGCVLLCPENAMFEKERPIGRIREGVSGEVIVKTGILNPGEASGVPIIKKLLSKENGEGKKERIKFIDCPPGSGCSVIESIREADYCVLVAEPTLFGVYNLNIVVDLVRHFKKPAGVVVNKYLRRNNPADEYCEEKGLEVLAWIPFSSELAELNSKALIAVRENGKYWDIFYPVLEKIVEGVRCEAAVDS